MKIENTKEEPIYLVPKDALRSRYIKIMKGAFIEGENLENMAILREAFITNTENKK